MGESVVKLQERLSFQSTTTAGNQPTSPPIAERASLRPPPAAHLLGSETDLESVSAPTRTNDKPDLHNPEKGPCQRPSHSTHSAPYGHSRVTYADPEDDGEDDGPKEHAIWILIYLSALSPLLALPIALYTLIMGTLLLLLLPVCFCVKKLPVCTRFRQFLSPLLIFQLGLIYSSYDTGDPVQSEISGITILVLVFMLSPLYAMAIAVATWVAGVFWLYTAILGNPDGKEDRDDGREAVLAVRGWWERWLIHSLEPADHSPLWGNGSESGY